MLKNNADLDLEVADLLVCSGFLKPHELDKALANRRHSGERLKNVLLECRMVDEAIFEAANSVIEQIRQARIPRASARTALYMIGNCRMSMDETLTKLGLLSSGNPWHKQLSVLAESKKWETAS